MKLLVYSLLAVLIGGGIYYRAEVSEYFTDLAAGSSGSGGSSVVDSMRDMGNSTRGLFGR